MVVRTRLYRTSTSTTSRMLFLFLLNAVIAQLQAICQPGDITSYIVYFSIVNFTSVIIHAGIPLASPSGVVRVPLNQPVTLTCNATGTMVVWFANNHPVNSTSLGLVESSAILSKSVSGCTQQRTLKGSANSLTNNVNVTCVSVDFPDASPWTLLLVEGYHTVISTAPIPV